MYFIELSPAGGVHCFHNSAEMVFIARDRRTAKYGFGEH